MMSEEHVLVIDGEVQRRVKLSFADLESIDDEHQISDVSRIDPQRQGDAVTLAGLLTLAGPKESATYLGLHSSSDDFHASIPLDVVRDRAIVIYRVDGQPLPVRMGGPVRFYVQDHAACQTEEVDECANVKFVDRMELTAGKGFDNRPTDEEEHEKLHGGGME